MAQKSDREKKKGVEEGRRGESDLKNFNTQGWWGGGGGGGEEREKRRT